MMLQPCKMLSHDVHSCITIVMLLRNVMQRITTMCKCCTTMLSYCYNVTTVFTYVQRYTTTYTHIQQCAYTYKHVVLMFPNFVTSSTDVQWSVMLFQLNATLSNNVTTMYNDVTTICNNGTTMYDNVCIVVTTTTDDASQCSRLLQQCYDVPTLSNIT